MSEPSAIFPIDPTKVFIKFDHDRKTVYVVQQISDTPDENGEFECRAIALPPSVALLLGSALVHAARILLEPAPPAQEEVMN